MPTLVQQIDANTDRWRDLDSSWRAMAARDLPAAGDSLDDLREKNRDFQAAAAQAKIDHAQALAELEPLARAGIAAGNQLADLADQLIAAGDAAGAAEANQAAESMALEVSAMLNAAEAARTGGLVKLIQAGEQLAAALAAAGAALESQGALSWVEELMREAAKVIGATVGVIGGALLIGAAGLLAFYLVQNFRKRRRA